MRYKAMPPTLPNKNKDKQDKIDFKTSTETEYMIFAEKR